MIRQLNRLGLQRLLEVRMALVGQLPASKSLFETLLTHYVSKNGRPLVLVFAGR